MKVEVRAADNAQPAGAAPEHAPSGEFLTRAAYAIRSPVNIIVGYSELIAQRLAALGDDSQQPYIESIRRSGQQILEAINRILDYSRIEQGVFSAIPERIALAGLLERLTQDFRVLAAAKKLGLICEIEEPGAAVRSDSYCLTAALSNLIDNAIKFTHKGGAVLKLCRDSQERLCIEVRDTGVGFDPQETQRVLAGIGTGGGQRYEQSGLGLMLAHKYLGLIGAPLAVVSSPGQGSVFTIVFPSALEEHYERRRAPAALQAVAAPQPDQDHGAPPPNPAFPSAHPVTVLVVEDQPDQALYMRALLKATGEATQEVVVASSAEQAILRLEELGAGVGLILMDLALPGGEDGLTLIRRLRADPRWRRVPIVVTTAHAFEDDRARALAAGASAYLAKPIDATTLRATIGALPLWEP
jgi:CheY-like chemotaxis protein/anti-sigma regulatory factor (Ser/Thr protein kinase)